MTVRKQIDFSPPTYKQLTTRSSIRHTPQTPSAVTHSRVLCLSCTLPPRGPMAPNQRLYVSMSVCVYWCKCFLNIISAIYCTGHYSLQPDNGRSMFQGRVCVIPSVWSEQIKDQTLSDISIHNVLLLYSQYEIQLKELSTPVKQRKKKKIKKLCQAKDNYY